MTLSASWPAEGSAASAPQHYDLLIIGAGMVGATLACALRRLCARPPRLLLVEAARVEAAAPAAQPGFDARSTELSHGSVEALRELDLWDDLREHAAPIEHIHVSEQGRFGSVRLH